MNPHGPNVELNMMPTIGPNNIPSPSPIQRSQRYFGYLFPNVTPRYQPNHPSRAIGTNMHVKASKIYSFIYIIPFQSCDINRLNTDFCGKV